MRFFVGTPCRPVERDIQCRIHLMQSVGFFNPGHGGFLELIGGVRDFQENWDSTVAVAYPYRDWFGVLHCPVAKDEYLFSGATDMSEGAGLDMAKSCVDMALALRIGKVVLHADVIARERPSNGKLYSKQLAAMENISAVANYGRKMRVMVCVENMPNPGSFDQNSDQFVDLMDYHKVSKLACDAAVRDFLVAYDVCHAATVSKGVGVQLANLGVLGHIHLSDAYSLGDRLFQGGVPIHPRSIIGEKQWEKTLEAIPDEMTVTLEVYEENVLNPIRARQALEWIIRQQSALR